ncbi:MAG: efflux RND transporter permease subunit, partial [Methylococcaceae bacterium]|nr:efflux RND transporter permease subunit [Methylococcaceae bacterium]
MQTSTISEQKGPIRWMAKHGVAANLLMATLILGGLIFMKSIGQEVFPEFQLDIVSINVAYPGASPDEVEKGIILAIEDAVSDLDGVDEINSTAKEGVARVLVSAERGADVQLLVQDIQKEVDRITTFPDDAEEPQIKVLNPRRPVMSLVLYGQAKDTVLHELAEQFREQLLQDSNISQVELEGIRPMEISIEVPQENLRRYKLSLSEIATRVQNASVDLPAGSVKTTGGEILIRMKERKDVGQQFANIPIINAANGSMVLLSDIAHIHDGYQDTDYVATFNEQPAVMVQVYNVGDRSPTQVSESVIGILPKVNQQLPDGVKAEIRYDASVDYTDRVNLLLKNSAQGLILVFLSLALFLEMRLAFWVMMGIPTAFLGAFLFLPLFGVTLNMISLFAFIIALGIVVDDAIVIGENVYEYRQKGLTPMQAAIEGAREMAAPITFSILSNVATFIPLFFIPGEMGKIFFMIPIV